MMSDMNDAGVSVERELTEKGYLPADRVRKILSRERIDVETLMLRMLPLAAECAVAPVSQFAVGAVAQAITADGGPGGLYLGANLEFTGEALGCSVHAEQSAVNNAWLHGENRLRSIAVSAPPCGHCRQFLRELAFAQELQILVEPNDSEANASYTKHSLAELLPAAFGPEHLGINERLMQPATGQVAVDESADPLTREAAAAASASYAPYTGNLAGVALRTNQGELICGRVAENAAFNPSLSPMASALATLQMQSTQQSFDIVDAVLVEAAAVASQRSLSAALLRSVAGDQVRLRYHQLRVDLLPPTGSPPAARCRRGSASS
jgi:cytidine deaminase